LVIGDKNLKRASSRSNSGGQCDSQDSRELHCIMLSGDAEMLIVSGLS
jgi:hypothetical protein